MDLVLHRNDLRVQDNHALSCSENAVPLYIFDSEWLENELVSDQRIEFVLESLKELNGMYVERGSYLVLKYGETEKVLEELAPRFDRVLFNRDPNHFRQDLEERLRSKHTDLPGSPAAGGIERSEWSQQISEWFSAEMYLPPSGFEKPDIDSDVGLEEIRERFEVRSDKQKFSEGGRSEAEKRLSNFIESIESYAGCISSPSRAEKFTSHLSPYIRYGCISPREVYKRVEEHAEDGRGKSMFQDRIVWQQHFNKKLEDNPELFEKAINPVYQDLHRQGRDKEKIEAWKNGKTGYPLVDASMRALVETGRLNFRMRAMCASFYSYILKQWWKEGADFFYKHLIDADVAINYYQWQMQSGLVGVHANRVYDPTKQVEDNDPEGEFIKKYVPELRGVPKEFIAEPWKMPERIQESCSVIIGEDYPEPIVDYEREARKAREFFKAKAPEAYAAFKDDEVWRKASLSSRHDRQEILEKADESQEDLSSFS